MTLRVSITFPSPAGLYRVVYDNESSDWNYISRTRDPEFIAKWGLSQAPAVYGYSPESDGQPNDYHVDENTFKDAYYELNDFNIDGVRDGMGFDRCENFLFTTATALYNNGGFPRRELLTMSGNVLQGIEWADDPRAGRCLKFKTLRPGDNVAGTTYETHPKYVHRFMIVQYRDGATLTVPKINRNGYLNYYLVSWNGYGFMPERNVRAL
jgi:hypothetical protein